MSERGGASELSQRLRARRAEIERKILASAYSVSNPSEASDSDYVEGLRAAVGTALDYALEVIESEKGPAPPVPLELLAQARRAARSGVLLDTVLRRYFAGFALLGDFLIQEAQEGPFDAATLQELMAGLSAILDRLVAAVSDEHARAAGGVSGSIEERRASHVRRLLAGEFLDASELVYDFEGHHLGLLARGPGAAQAVREIAAGLDCRLLLIAEGEDIQWAWLGSRQRTDPLELKHLAQRSRPTEVRLAIGEPAQGIEGWRLSHRQAKAALPIALRGQEPIVRYADVALLASLIQDELLVRSLRQLYIEPLSRERDGGKALRHTLIAYFKAERNVSSAAAMLGVNRKTIGNRLAAVERRIGRPLGSCAAELEAILDMTRLSDPPGAPTPGDRLR